MMGIFVPFDEKRHRSSIGWVLQECGCWDWVGSHAKERGPDCGTGYGMLSIGGTTKRAHRLVYERFRGPIPVGLTLDHLCRRRCCVNPDHMEIVTLGENSRRGKGVNGMNARKTTCPKGHPLSGDNLVQLKSGRRRCRICQYATQRDYWHSRQAEIEILREQNRALREVLRELHIAVAEQAASGADGPWLELRPIVRRATEVLARVTDGEQP